MVKVLGKYHAMDYSATKRNIVPMPDTTWVDLENIMLHEKRHTHKATYSSLCKISRVGKYVETQSRE